MGRLAAIVVAGAVLVAAVAVAALQHSQRHVDRAVAPGLSTVDLALVLGAVLLSVALGRRLRREARSEIEAMQAEGESTQ
jgi:membrane protein implicated in regulation of membrane protease activity